MAVVPLVMATSRDIVLRRAALRAAVLTAGVAALCWLGAFAYFGTLFPLAFYIKAMGGNDPEFANLFEGVSEMGLRAYGELLLPVVAGTLLLIALNLRATLRARLDVGLIVASVGFLLYYRFFVVQVMHYAQRFYFPTLPALIYLTLAALRRSAEEPPNWLRKVVQGPIERVGPLMSLTALAAAVLCEMEPNDPKAPASVLCPRAPPAVEQARQRRLWPGINLLLKMPDDLALATTEVGLPGALNPNRTIIDLVGLNEASVARGAWSPVQAVLAAKVDVVYLHSDYAKTNRGFATSAEFNREYEQGHPYGQRTLSVYLRRDSRYHAALIDALMRD